MLLYKIYDNIISFLKLRFEGRKSFHIKFHIKFPYRKLAEIWKHINSDILVINS